VASAKNSATPASIDSVCASVTRRPIHSESTSSASGLGAVSTAPFGSVISTPLSVSRALARNSNGPRPAVNTFPGSSSTIPDQPRLLDGCLGERLTLQRLHRMPPQFGDVHNAPSKCRTAERLWSPAAVVAASIDQMVDLQVFELPDGRELAWREFGDGDGAP